MKYLFLTLSLSILLIACHAKNPVLVAPPETFQNVKGQYGGFTVDFNPKVDILFVIDNSGSMKEEQKMVRANINKFAAELAKDSVIDFHIAATSVYDTSDDETRQYKFIPDFANGELWPLINPRTGLPIDGPRYVSRQTSYPEYHQEDGKDPAYVEVLKSSIYLGVRDYTEGGPQKEETLSPMVAAFSTQLPSDANKGFFRSDSHLVVIMMTDAEDASPNLDAVQAADFLYDLKDENFFVYMLIPNLNEPGCADNIEKDSPKRLYTFADELGPHHAATIDLCSNKYESYLTQIGKETRQRMNARIIPLQAMPEVDRQKWDLSVRYGQQIIPQGPGGWTYIPEGPAIQIEPDIKLIEEENARISIEYVAVKSKNLRNGRARSITE